MKKFFRSMLEGSILLALPLLLTSCEDILGEWDKPAPANITPSTTKVSVTSITLDKTTLTANVGDAAQQLTATVKPDDATNKTVTWNSSNPNVATVSETGLVSFVAAGTATITATADGKEATCPVTVSAVCGANQYRRFSYTAEDGLTSVIVDIPGGATDYAGKAGAETWAAGTYVVSGSDVKITGGLTLEGNVSLIIKDDAKLTITGNIDANSHVLSIYGQDGEGESMGKLIVTTANTTGAIYQPSLLNIHGCKIEAKNTGSSSCGILSYSGSTLTVFNGELTAMAVNNTLGASGIQTGGGHITINGGTVIATGSNGSSNSGGCGIHCGAGTFTINGGTVNATGGNGSGGYNGGDGINTNNDRLLINNCTKVTATGGTGAANGKAFSNDIKIATTLQWSADNGTNWVGGPGGFFTITPAPQKLIVQPKP